MKTWFIIVAAFLVGAVLSVVVLTAVAWVVKNRRRKRTRTGGRAGKHLAAEGEPKERRKVEFSKLILALVLMTYFVGVGVGVKVALIDMTQLGALLAFIGAPTAAAIGFYAWKAKAENIIKIKKNNPEEAAGFSVDLNDSDTQEGQNYG